MIDTQGIQDFEGGFAALLDALDELRALSVPTERDGVKGIVKWHGEVKKILARIPDLPDTSPLMEFAEDVEREFMALEDAARAALAGAREKPYPRDEGLLPKDEGFPGEIVTEVGGGKYTFKEKVRSDATTWADKAGGRTGDCYESNDVAGIAVGTIIQIRIEYDATGTLRYVFNYEYVVPTEEVKTVKIVSYSGGVYVVQPVVRSSGSWANDGSQLAGIHNYGEVQTDEAGYLAGPGGEDIYVPLFVAGDESFILVHPPRMV